MIKSGPSVIQMQLGELVVSGNPAVIGTHLGSCVALCLYSTKRKVGGIVHFSLPEAPHGVSQSEGLRYADTAIRELVNQLSQLTMEDPCLFQAKLVGGADIPNAGNPSVGKANIQMARKVLIHLGITIAGEDVGGSSARQIYFHVPSFRVQVAELGAKVVDPTSKTTTAFHTSVAGRKKKVLIVDDSRTIRELLTRIITEDPELEIMGKAASASEADEIIKREKPDVITLDVHMPGKTGVEWLESLPPGFNIPVIMISSLNLQEGNEVFRALELGAVDYLQKPALSEIKVVAPIIREKVKVACGAKVRLSKNKPPVRKKLHLVSDSQADFQTIIAIGASTGGTEALKEVLVELPENIPPIVIVQHIPPVFSRAFADRLNSLCPFEVREACDGDELKPSRVLIAPGGRQMKIVPVPRGGFRVRITDDPPVNRHSPSVDYLFDSVADLVGPQAIGVILTGMGGDGGRGLLRMKNAGARTVVQDEASCVVYGMPKVAFELGAAEKVLDLGAIPQELINLYSRKKRAA